MSLSPIVAAAFTLPDRRPIHEWASDNITLPPVLTKTGAFDVSGSRHFIGPFDALRNDQVREVNVMAPVRGGKTLIADIAAPWAIVNDHASVLRVMQSDEVSSSHSELRAMPIALSAHGIQLILPRDRHKVREQEIIFTNGLPLIICGPSIGNLQSRGFKWVICDEPWLYKQGILGQAKARLGDFVRIASSKFLCISQGGVEDDDWDTQWQSGERNEWHVQCASCGHYMLPEWSAFRPDGSRWGIMFDGEKTERGRYNIRKAIETLRFECEKCSHVHLDSPATRAVWNASGRYQIIGEPNDTRKSFHWTALIDFPWSELLEEWLNARRASTTGNFEPTIQFVQKRLARPKSEKTVHEGALNFTRAKITDEKWECEVLRAVTVDRQSEDTYWLTARQWAKDTGESRKLIFAKCFSESDIIAVVNKIAPTRIRINIGGAIVECFAVMIDSGYRPKGDQGVYAMCARNKWIATRGDDTPFFWHTTTTKTSTDRVIKEQVQKPYAAWTWGDPGEGTAEQGRRHSPLLRFAANSMTDRMQELIDRGLWVEPEGDSETDMGREYERQMSSEHRSRRTNKTTLREEFFWKCPSGNNHARDCGKQQVLMAQVLGIL